MPPVPKAVSASSNNKASRYSSSPDSEPTLPEPALSTLPNKKKKKNAANRQAQNGVTNDRAIPLDATRDEPPPARPRTILSQIRQSFQIPAGLESPLLDGQDEELATSEKVSDQYTPPNDTWLEDDVYSKNPPVEQRPRLGHHGTPPAEPGFSTKSRYDSRSPPVSPQVRHVRPVSFSSNVVPPATIPRASPSAYAYAPSAYGSPPAPHLPQQHFYHAQDVDLNFPRTSNSHFREEPTLIKHITFPFRCSDSQQAVLLGFDGRLNLMHLDSGKFDEIAMLDGLSGTVVDAVMLEWGATSDPFAELRPLAAVVIHGPRDVQAGYHNEVSSGDTIPSSRHQTGLVNSEYTTRVEVFSLTTQQSVTLLLETPPQVAQGTFRGVALKPPGPIGHLKLQVSGAFLTVASGVSGEVYVFTFREGPSPTFECIAKLWTAIQPQSLRRDTSHPQGADTDISPADIGRSTKIIERAISSLGGRWLAISPASSPSKPSLGAVIGPNVSHERCAGVETISSPARPSVTCEVDSPDADTLFGKVARGVAQELVKGAKWLGDQGYQTWQSYWRKDQSPSQSTTPRFSPPTYPVTYAQNMFPPTYGEASQNSKEPELVAIYDLQNLSEMTTRKGADDMRPLATFQPPRGCSFLSFAPHGLNLLTAGRKGDVQYVWDLMQTKHSRTQIVLQDDERASTQPRVRQIAKYERLSGSTIIDVVWNMSTGARFAILTKNKTIHLFDLPPNAVRWPPPRAPRKVRPSSKSIDSTQHDAPVPSGFFASAMNIASQAQPMIANLRGRTPSMSGGLAGIGQTGIGFASATGARGGKAVAAGLSKSLGAATETVSQIRHAGETRLHLKSQKEPVSGTVFWVRHGKQLRLAVLEADMIKQYQVRRNTYFEQREKDNGTVFAARKGLIIKIPYPSKSDNPVVLESPESVGKKSLTGYWKAVPAVARTKAIQTHPLSYAEMETNAPYQPFHSDRRVVMSIYSDVASASDESMPTVITTRTHQAKSSTKSTKVAKNQSQWVFGDDIQTTPLNISKIQIPDEGNDGSNSVIYRETVRIVSPLAKDEDPDQIVSTTRRRKVKKGHGVVADEGSDVEKDDGFFEDDCDVLDFATDRV